MSRISELLKEREDLIEERAASEDPAERANLLREISEANRRLFAAGYTPGRDG